MCLTEPQCGTDLGLMRTRAEPQADGSSGSPAPRSSSRAGEHDLAENIVHLVLARLPDAPAGTQGHQPVHRAQVPAATPTASLGARNGVCCARHRAQDGHPRHRPPAQMQFDGATGWLVGAAATRACGDVRDDERRPPGRRHAGAGLTEVAYQNALAYAKERIQMRSPDRPEGRTSRPTRSSCIRTCARCC